MRTIVTRHTILRYTILSRFIFCLLFCCTTITHLCGVTLGDRFQNAEKGDFAVISHEKHITLFHILDKTDEKLTIEEITAQERYVNEENSPTFSWQKWVAEGAPHSNAWVISVFNRKNFHHLATYSYTTDEWLSPDEQLSFLPMLFNLPLEKIASIDRKRIGPTPLAGEQDFRKIWNPKIVYMGKVETLPTDAYTVVIPKDVIELGGKRLDLYFPVGKECLPYFPYWIEIRSVIAKVKLRTIDSGKNLTSPAEQVLHQSHFQQL